ncbi:MAG: divalent-cation tolerance protein CutA [Chlamydiota bacterium]
MSQHPKFIIIYVTCASMEQAKEIGRHLLEKKLCACVNILPEMHSLYFWPKAPTVEEGKEVVLLLKTKKSLFANIEKEIQKMHSYDIPCIFSFPIENLSSDYEKWIEDQLS